MLQAASVQTASTEAIFKHYGKSFQEKIFQGLLSDHRWASQMYEVMKPEFFDVRYLEYLTSRYFDYFAKYKCFPSLQLLITIVKDGLSEGTDILLRDQIVDYLHRIKSNPHAGDIEFAKDKSLDFCHRQ